MTETKMIKEIQNKNKVNEWDLREIAIKAQDKWGSMSLTTFMAHDVVHFVYNSLYAIIFGEDEEMIKEK